MRSHVTAVLSMTLVIGCGGGPGPGPATDAAPERDAPMADERCDGSWTITIRGGADGCGELFGNVPDAPDFDVATDGTATSSAAAWTMASGSVTRTASGCELAGTAVASVPNPGAGGSTEWTLTFTATSSTSGIDGMGDAEGRLVGGAGSGRCSTVVLFAGSVSR